MAGENGGETAGLDASTLSHAKEAGEKKLSKQKSSRSNGRATSISATSSSGKRSSKSRGASNSRRKEQEKEFESRAGPPVTKTPKKRLKKSISMSDFQKSGSLEMEGPSSTTGLKMKRRGSAAHVPTTSSTSTTTNQKDKTLKRASSSRRRTASVGAKERPGRSRSLKNNTNELDGSVSQKSRSSIGESQKRSSISESQTSNSIDASDKRKPTKSKERRNSKRNLLDSSSRKQSSSRRGMSDGSSKKKLLEDGSDPNRLPIVQLKQKAQSSRSMTIIDDVGDQPPMLLTKSVSSRRGKLMTDTSEAKRSSSLGSKSRRAALEREFSEQNTTAADDKDTVGTKAGGETKDASTGNVDKNSAELDTMGFPDSSEMDEDIDFGHLPDFQVGDFSFGDLNFPFDSKGKIEFDDEKAAQLSSQEKSKTQSESQESEKPAKQKISTTGTEQPAAIESKRAGVASTGTSEAKAVPVSWICDNCKEQHDETILQFCGMCGADRPKTTPSHKKGVRKPSDNGARRESISNRKSPRRSQDDSGVKSARRSASLERPSSAGALRKVRTPRSRSKGKVKSSDKDVTMIVKCLDGDEGGALDMETLNQQLTTFESTNPPITPSRSKKKHVRRSKSDVTDAQRPTRAGRIPTASAPQTPRGLGKKKLKAPVRRSQTCNDAPGGGGALANMRKASVRQAIPRRAKSSATDYLQQIQNGMLDVSGHGMKKGGKDELTTQSAHSMGAHSLGAASTGTNSAGNQSANTTGAIGMRSSLTAMRPSFAKTASSRFLGGLSGISSTFTMGGVKNITNAVGITSKKSGTLLVDSDDDDDDDDDEFANELKKNAVDEKPDLGMLRDFPNVETDFSKSPRRPKSSRNLVVDDDGGLPQTPRRRRASIAAARQAHADTLNRTPRRRRGRLDEPEAGSEGKSRVLKNRLSRRGGLPFDGDDDEVDSSDRKSAGPAVLDYDDIDIDIDEEDEDDAPDHTTTPRRARKERLTRSMPRRPRPDNMDAGAVTPRNLNARSRIKRASVCGFQAPDLDAVEPVKAPATPGTLNARGRIRRASLGAYQAPDLEPEPEPEPAKVPPTPGTLSARRQVRRASLGGFQPPPELEPEPAPKPIGGDDLAPESGQGNRPRAGRPGRSRGRRGSIETRNPLLQQAIAHMPQDPTHAVRSDIKEEWKRQEQIEDMRKKAKNMQKKYNGQMGTLQLEPAPLFAAEFDGKMSDGAGKVDPLQESGADLELGDDEDVSDLSSQGE